MNDDQVQFLSLLHLPGQFTVLQTSWYLGFPFREIPFLTRTKVLKPAGRPTRKATKLYNYCLLRRLRNNERWMNRATSAIYRHTEHKNRKSRTKRKRRS
jgi:hypothetical protein